MNKEFECTNVKIGNDILITKVEKASLRQKRGLILIGKKYQFDAESGDNFVEPIDIRILLSDAAIKKIKEVM